MRFRGSLEPDEADVEEPMRTLRALSKSSLWRSENAGDEHGKLRTWLVEPAGHGQERCCRIFMQVARLAADLSLGAGWP